jgi:two-component system sensor histidine kinase KdpD
MDAAYFLDLIKKSRRGKFKVYIGMSPGVGKTYRMLQEARTLLGNGIDVRLGFIETHNRPETVAQLEGLPLIPRRTLFYKGRQLEEMDLQAILHLHPQVVVIDELAHSNIPGSKNEKRWQDVLEVLNAGINVISAVNIQHLESLNEEVHQITGIMVQETVPDSVIQEADEVVNIDLTADELIARLKEGKIYDKSKVETALDNFFKSDKILQLRELALKEVASQVERKVDQQLSGSSTFRPERFMACISSNADGARKILRKTARLASYYQGRWYAVYVQTSDESSDKINLASQRHLINNFKLATELGAEVLQLRSEKVAEAIFEVALEKGVTTLCLGKPHSSPLQRLMGTSFFNQLLNKVENTEIDLIIIS